MDERAIPEDERRTYTSRINITFRFYREGEFRPVSSFSIVWICGGISLPYPPNRDCVSKLELLLTKLSADFHPKPGVGPLGPRQGTPLCRCGIPTCVISVLCCLSSLMLCRRLLRADQKAKARSRLPISPSKARASANHPKTEEVGDDVSGSPKTKDGPGLIDDDMVFFWQCQSPGRTGDLKGCGFFRILDMKAEGRGSCVGNL